MPLNAVDFVPKGPIRSADIKQFVDLFTGVMLDQPITFRNSVVIGGNQSPTQAALSLYGATGQTSNLINLYPSTASLNPTFGFAASGAFGWGPGGSLVQDTFLSRIATQGHPTDTAGILITPALEVGGTLLLHGNITWPSGLAIGDGGGFLANRFILNINTDLAVSNAVYLGYDHLQWLEEAAGGNAISARPAILVNGANAGGSGLTYAQAQLQVRGHDVPDTAGALVTLFAAYAVVPNWAQFNVHLYKVTAGTGWPGVALLLDYDVDAADAVGGRIAMLNGKVGVGGIPDPNGNIFQVAGSASINGTLAVTGTSNLAGNVLAQGNINAAGTVFAATVSANTGQINGNLNVDTITIDSAGNSANAKIALSSVPGPKISYYDVGAGTFFGVGINSAELYTSVPFNNMWSIRRDGAGGTQIIGITPSVVGSDGAAPLVQTQSGGFYLGPGFGGGQPNLTFYTPTDPQGQGQTFRVVGPSTRPASVVGGGEVHIGIRLFCDGDITSGTNMHAVSFMTTSDPNLKSNAVVITDADCMARIRAPSMPVYTYTITPSVPGGYPAPTQPDMGFMAPDVYANSPEFVALDSSGTPTAVVYGQMASLLWGALRSLDARCVAKGI